METINRFLNGGFEPFWPHTVLLSLAVIASVAVGGGIIFEHPKYSAIVHRVAFWLVVSGIAVEAVCTIFLFVFDEGISNSQYSQIVSLEKRLAFRSLSDEQFGDVADQLKPFAGQTFQVITYWKNPEALAIANRMADALIRAGWIIKQPTTYTAIVGVETGVSVWFPQSDNEKVARGAKTLVYALLVNQVYAELDPQAGKAPPADPTIKDKIIIEVGIKP